jgi:hypothetical protein
MGVRRGFACVASVMAVTNAYPAAGKAITGSVAVDARATNIPESCLLSWLHGELDTIAGGATTVTWYLAADAGGDVPLTDVVTETIVVGITTATDGGIATAIDLDYYRATSGTAGSIYLFAKTNAGTVNLKPRLTWRVDVG